MTTSPQNIPAYVLLFLEWFRLQMYNKSIEFPKSKILFVATFIVLFLWIFYLLNALNLTVLTAIPLDIGQDPGVSMPWMKKVFIPVSCVLAVGVLLLSQKMISKRFVLVFVALLCLGYAANNMKLLLNFWTNPSYASRQCTQTLVKNVEEEAVVIGDWAPFFAVNTNLKAVYMSHNANFNIVNILNIRPMYFIHSNNVWSVKNFDLLNSHNDIALINPMKIGNYIDNEILLYEINYKKKKKKSSFCT